MGSILETFEARHPGSRRLAERARGVFPSGITHDLRAFAPFPISVERAQGARKWDVDGHEYVDYIGGHGALLLGHNRAEVIEAVHEALDEGTHFGSSHAREIEWGEQVLRMVPCAERVRFTSSGTEATMMALRLARAFTGRSRVVKLAEHFHGWHDLAVGQLGEAELRPQAVGVPPGFYDDLTIVPAGDTAALEEALAARDVAALILEPTGAHWGLHPIPSSYLEAARELTRESGTQLILDEVITGFRMAPGGAQERYGVTPDLSTHAKILAGGLPGGCVAGREEVLALLDLREGDDGWNRRRRVPHQGTYNAQPPAAAAGIAALRLIARESGTQLILDEVITGFRMTPGGAQERYGVTPDLSTHAKILAGGLPGGCVAGREEVLALLDLREGDDGWNRRRRVPHQGTYNAQPPAAAAGIAALRLIAAGGEIERADQTTAELVRGLNALFAEEGVAGSAWGVSSMWHLNLGYPAPRPAEVEWDALEPPDGVTPELVVETPLKQALLNHGVDLMGSGGMVSSAHGSAEIEATIGALRAAVGDLRAEGFLD